MSPIGAGASCSVSDDPRHLGDTPLEFPSCVMWGDVEDLSSKSDTDPVDSWFNRATGLHPTNTGSNRPTYKLSAINGKPAIRFTAASSQALNFPSGALPWFKNVPGLTVLAVVQPITIPAVGSILSASVNASSAVRAAVTYNATNWVLTERPDDTTLTTTTSAGVPATGVPTMILAVFDFANGSVKQYVNGALDGTSSVTGQNTPNTASQAIAIGRRPDGSQFLDAYVPRIAAWNVVYSRTQLTRLMARWATPYGITLS